MGSLTHRNVARAAATALLLNALCVFTPITSARAGASAPPALHSVAQAPGTTTNDSASAGNLGQVVKSTVACSATTGLTSGTTANVTSISLSAGDWDVEGVVGEDLNSGTNSTIMLGAVSTTSASLPGFGALGQIEWQGSAGGAGYLLQPTGKTQISLASTGTAYLVIDAVFTGSTAGSCGSLIARRAR